MRSNPNFDEKILLRALSLGDKTAFEFIFDQYHRLVYAFAKKLTRSDSISEEIVQEVFIRIWTKREKILDVENFSAYLNRIVRNQTYNTLRQMAIRERAAEKLQQDAALITQENNSRVDQEALEALLSKAIDQLTPQQKKVYTLCYQEGYKYQEAAELLNISSLTVHSHMKIALKTIRSYIMARVDAVLVFIFAFLGKE